MRKEDEEENRSHNHPEGVTEHRIGREPYQIRGYLFNNPVWATLYLVCDAYLLNYVPVAPSALDGWGDALAT